MPGKTVMTDTINSDLREPVAGLNVLPGFESHAVATASADVTGMAATLPENLLTIPVSIQVVIGSVRLPLSRITRLGPGEKIDLEERLGEPALLLVNGKDVARGNLFVLDEDDGAGRLGIVITEVISSGTGPAR
jgi:flagellar motor switch protein FliN/FliY